MLGRKKKHRVGLIFIVLILLLVIAGVIAIKSSTIKTVTITGNSFYTEDEIKNFLFDSTVENNTIKCYLDNHLGKNKKIPFIERYQIEIVNNHEVEVIVYEKNIVGYVDYVGSCMYFDRDGTVVESSSERLEGICEVRGITFSQIVLHKQIQTSIKGLFDQVLLMTQLFEKYEMDVELINFDQSCNVSVTIGEIKVELGEAEDMDLKISELNNILPALSGRKGTLYLDDIQFGSAIDGTYPFKTEE